jgi:hypothetical protein
MTAMRITLIGGVERNANALEKIARDAGHELDFHGGHMTKQGVTAMERIIARADLVLVTTAVNSHTAVKVARETAARFERELVMMTSCNPTRFRELLAARSSS